MNQVIPLIAPGRRPRGHIHRVASQDSQERRELLNLRQRVLCPNLRHGRFEVHIEQVLEMLRRPFVRIAHQPDRTVPVRPRLYLRQADVPEGEGR